MNAASQMIYSTLKYEHVTPLLHQFHWLKALQHIDFRFAVLVYKCLHGLTPACLADELQLVVNSESRQRLRSSITSSLIVCHTLLFTASDLACTYLEQSVSARHLGVLTISVQSSSEDPSLLIVSCWSLLKF